MGWGAWEGLGDLADRPIGVMDSGLGGLTVVSELWRQLPNEAVLFYGDSARCPYGEREDGEILELALRALDFLEEQGSKMLVIACNTATAVALEAARRRYGVPVFGVVAPGARAAIAATETRRVGVIGTRATIRSGSYPLALHKTHPGIEVSSRACPEFVRLAERGGETSDVDEAVARALEGFAGPGMDTLILGCTHFPLLAGSIQKAVGPGVRLISSAEETAREVSLHISERNMGRIDASPPRHRFFTSGNADLFRASGVAWLGREISVEFRDVWKSAAPVAAPSAEGT